MTLASIYRNLLAWVGYSGGSSTLFLRGPLRVGADPCLGVSSKLPHTHFGTSPINIALVFRRYVSDIDSELVHAGDNHMSHVDLRWPSG